MVGIVERGVPERHDAVADIFVDGAHALGDDLGHRRQKAVHEMRQRLGIELFRKAGEAAYVAEHDRHGSRLAAELEPLGMGGELFDIVRRHVVRERAPDLALARLGAQMAEQRGDEIDHSDYRPGIDRVDQQLSVLEGEPRRPEGDGHRGAPEHRARHRADPRQAEYQPGPDQQREQDFGPDRPVGPNQKGLLEDLLQQLRVDFDPGNVGCDRGRLLIVDDPRGRGSDQHDVIGEERAIEIAGQDLRRGNEAVGPRLGIMEPYPPRGIGRYRQLADADRGQSGLLAKALLGVCPGRAADIAARPEREPQRFSGERRVGLVAEPQNQWNPSHHMIPIDGLVQKPISGGRRFQHRQVRDGTRKTIDTAQRIVPGKGKSGLGGRRPGLAVVAQDKPRHHGSGPDGLREASIGVRHCRQQLFRLLGTDAVLCDQRQQQLG